MPPAAATHTFQIAAKSQRPYSMSLAYSTKKPFLQQMIHFHGKILQMIHFPADRDGRAYDARH